MKKPASLTALLLASSLLSGCVMVGKPGKTSRASSSQCHPSQYWDGSQCRHKGKGKGSRKHDG